MRRLRVLFWPSAPCVIASALRTAAARVARIPRGRSAIVATSSFLVPFLLACAGSAKAAPGNVADALGLESSDHSSPATSKPWWVRTFEPPESLPAPYPNPSASPDRYWRDLLLSGTSKGEILPAPKRRHNRSFRATTGPNNGSNYADWSLLTQDVVKSHGWNGGEVWVRMKIYFPRDFTPTGFTAGQLASSYNWFLEFHNDWGYKNLCPTEVPSIAWTIQNDRPRKVRQKPHPRFAIQLIGGTETTTRNCQPQTRWIYGTREKNDHWYDIVEHVKFSPDAATSVFEGWIDGKRIASLHFPTLFRRPNGSISSAYFDCGYYRRASNYYASVYIDDVREGPSRKSLFPRNRRR
jgi:hypothetical protein